MNEFVMSFQEMDISDQSLFDYVDSELVPFMTNGSFTTGAKVYEVAFTSNVDYYTIPNWGNTCYNGNCNVAWLRTLNRVTRELGDHGTVDNVNFVGTDTDTIELGNFNDVTLVAVFKSDNTIEFWEVDWSVNNIATQSGFTGTWSRLDLFDEILIKYTIPVELEASYNLDNDDPGFLSVQDGYLRHGEEEETAGATGTVYFFNPIANQDILNSIP